MNVFWISSFYDKLIWLLKIMIVKNTWPNWNITSITICVGLLKSDINDTIIGIYAMTETGNTFLNKRCIKIVLYRAVIYSGYIKYFKLFGVILFLINEFAAFNHLKRRIFIQKFIILYDTVEVSRHKTIKQQCCSKKTKLW